MLILKVISSDIFLELFSVHFLHILYFLFFLNYISGIIIDVAELQITSLSTTPLISPKCPHFTLLILGEAFSKLQEDVRDLVADSTDRKMHAEPELQVRTYSHFDISVRSNAYLLIQSCKIRSSIVQMCLHAFTCTAVCVCVCVCVCV